MSKFESSAGREDQTPTVRYYSGVGELVVGGNDTNRVLFTALCLLNDPDVNQYLLDCKLKFQDRITKTRIFPRDGMALPDGTIYEEEENS